MKTSRLDNLSLTQIYFLWVAGFTLLIPILFVVLNPEAGSIILFFLGFVFNEKVYNYFQARYKHKKQLPVLMSGGVLIVSFIVTTAVLVSVFYPICRWIEIQETIKIRFLNFETTYGLALCYNGEVDFVTLGFGAYVHYLLAPTFYLIYQLFRLPAVLYRRIRT